MEKKTEKKSEPKKTRGRRPAAAQKGRDEAPCPEELNMPQQSREEYVAGVLEQIRDFDEKLADLETEMESSGWNDIAEYRGQLDDLRLHLNMARAKSVELETVADSDWPSLYEEMEETLLEAADRVENLTRGLAQVIPE